MAFQHSPRLAAYPLAMPPRLYPVPVPVSPEKQQQQQQQQQGEFSKGEKTWKSILGNVTTTTTTARTSTTTALPHDKDGEKEKHGSRRVMGSSRRYALVPLQQVLLQQKQQRPSFGMRRRVTTPV